MSEIGNFFGNLFKDFPLFTIMLTLGLIYMFWLSTGGVERGEERRASGADGLFLEVNGVPDSFQEEELFGSIPAKELED